MATTPPLVTVTSQVLKATEVDPLSNETVMVVLPAAYAVRLGLWKTLPELAEDDGAANWATVGLLLTQVIVSYVVPAAPPVTVAVIVEVPPMETGFGLADSAMAGVLLAPAETFTVSSADFPPAETENVVVPVWVGSGVTVRLTCPLSLVVVVVPKDAVAELPEPVLETDTDWLFMGLVSEPVTVTVTDLADSPAVKLRTLGLRETDATETGVLAGLIVTFTPVAEATVLPD